MDDCYDISLRVRVLVIFLKADTKVEILAYDHKLWGDVYKRWDLKVFGQKC